MIHRVIFGSVERFIGILIEHYAGKFPVWLSPVQVKVLSVSEKTFEYASEVAARLKAAVEAEVDRLKRLVDLGGYIPCPDHRIAPDAKFELVQYYCELMRKL